MRTERLNGLSAGQRLGASDQACAPCSRPGPPYLISAGRLLGCPQALVHTDDTHFGSSLGGKPAAPHEIHDHHMVLQLCTKRFDLECSVHSRSRVAGSAPILMGVCGHSRVLHDTRSLVTSAREPGRHNFLCLIQVLSAAGGTWGAPRLRPLPEFSSSTAPCPHTPAAQGAGGACGTLEGTFTGHEKTPCGCPAVPELPPAFSGHSVFSDFKDTFLLPAALMSWRRIFCVHILDIKFAALTS